MVNTDIESIAPENQPLTLESGVVVDVVPLKTREFFKLIKIITSGAGPVLGKMDLFGSDLGEDEFVAKLLGVVLMAVPEADDEAIEFIQAMVRPNGLIDRPFSQLNAADKEHNDSLWDAVYTETINPELEDTVSIIEAVVRREAGDLQKLGKRIRSMIELARKTGQLKSQGKTSSEASAEPSTLSPVSTDGTTIESLTSPSEESAKSSPRSRNGKQAPKETVVAL